MNRLKSFAAFWYDFLVGDDWRVAVGVVIGLAITYSLAHNGTNAWWIVPVAVALLLPLTLLRAIRKDQ